MKHSCQAMWVQSHSSWKSWKAGKFMRMKMPSQTRPHTTRGRSVLASVRIPDAVSVLYHQCLRSTSKSWKRCSSHDRHFVSGEKPAWDSEQRRPFLLGGRELNGRVCLTEGGPRLPVIEHRILVRWNLWMKLFVCGMFQCLQLKNKFCGISTHVVIVVNMQREQNRRNCVERVLFQTSTMMAWQPFPLMIYAAWWMKIFAVHSLLSARKTSVSRKGGWERG